jgi:hypothetical protein
MNVQQTIIRGIKEQLFFNDYLVLPGFGGFVLKSRTSHYSVSGGLIAPPSKTVSFNAQLKQNDGILSTWLQNDLKCTANESITHLNDFSEYCSGLLKAKRRFTLEGIGFFYLDFENNVCFEPQQDSNFLTSSFGLSSVSIKELSVNTEEPKKETIFIDRTLRVAEEETAPVKIHTKRRYSRMVTPLLIAILFVSLLGLLVNSLPINGDLRASVFGGNSVGAYQKVDYPELKIENSVAKIPAYVVDANGIAAINLDHTKTLAVNAVKQNFGTSLNSNSGDYEIVLGCFTVLDNAKRMVRKLNLKKVKAFVSGKNNKEMYVVSNGSFSTKEEASLRLSEIKDKFPHAWIKKGE